MEECGIHLRLKKGDEQLHSDEIDRYRAIFDLSPILSSSMVNQGSLT